LGPRVEGVLDGQRTDGRGEQPRLLVVDDDPSIVSQLTLAFEDDYQILSAQDPGPPGPCPDRAADLITLDLALETENPEVGFGLLDKCWPSITPQDRAHHRQRHP